MSQVLATRGFLSQGPNQVQSIGARGFLDPHPFTPVPPTPVVDPLDLLFNSVRNEAFYRGPFIVLNVTAYPNRETLRLRLVENGYRVDINTVPTWVNGKRIIRWYFTVWVTNPRFYPIIKN